MRTQRQTTLATIAALTLLLVLSATACSADQSSSPTVLPTQDRQPDRSQEIAATSVPSLLPTLSLESFAPIATPIPSPDLPTATTPSKPPTWYGADTIALFISGNEDRADLFGLNRDGAYRLLFSDVGDQVQVSRDANLAGFVRWSDDGRGILEIHNLKSGETQQIVPDSASGLFRFVFDPTGRRLVYLELGAPSATGVPWALVVADLETGATARYEALMSNNEARPLPGAPIGWSSLESASNELIVDTFLPYTEGGFMGVWGVTLPTNGESTSFEGLMMRELIPGAPVYLSRLYISPDARLGAFLGRNRDYLPDNYFPEFYDFAVNQLGVVVLESGLRTMVVDVSDGTALARALAWSPTGDRLLFAQGRYDGEEFGELSLKSAGLEGTAVTYGPLNLPLLGGLLSLTWCDPALALYLNWDGSAGNRRLFGFDLNTGVSSEIVASSRLEVVGCLPR